jgi:hypothetical protein
MISFNIDLIWLKSNNDLPLRVTGVTNTMCCEGSKVRAVMWGFLARNLMRL